MTCEKMFRQGALVALFLSVPVTAQPAQPAQPVTAQPAQPVTAQPAPPAQPAPAAAAPAPGTTIAAIPRPVPDFSTRDLDGRPRNWSELRGKLYLIDFWATWCLPCRETLPQLQAIHSKYSEKGNFSVLGIAIERTQSGAARASFFARGLGVTYPLYSDFGSGEARKAFAVNALPDLYLVDAEGIIVDRWLGSDIDFEDVEATIAERLAAPKENVVKADGNR